MTDDNLSSNPTASGEWLAHPMVRALLQELASKLVALAHDGLSNSIDLRRLPLPSGALDAFRAWLGRGEVHATVTALGTTTIDETAIAGVWWMRYANASGGLIGESLEIAACPALLGVRQSDIGAAAEALRQRLADLAEPFAMGTH